MAGEHIWQLPMLRGKNLCPVCGKDVFEHKLYSIAITYPNHITKFHECDVLYCANCDIPLADGSVGKQIFKDTGAHISIFLPKKHCSVLSVRNRMHYRKQKTTPPVHPREHDFPFELVGNYYSIWKLSKAICELPHGVSTCPKCHEKLVDDYTLIPVNDNTKAKIPGRLCPVCKTIYVSDAAQIAQIMRDNPLSKGFTLNGHELWDAAQKEKEHRQKAKEQKLFFPERKDCRKFPVLL